MSSMPGDATSLLRKRIPLNHKEYNAISVGEMRMFDRGYFTAVESGKGGYFSGRYRFACIAHSFDNLFCCFHDVNTVLRDKVNTIVAKDVNLHKEKNQYSLLTRSSIFLCNFIKIGYLSRAMLRRNTIGRPVQNSVIKFVTPHSGSSLSMGSSRMLSAHI